MSDIKVTPSLYCKIDNQLSQEVSHHQTEGFIVAVLPRHGDIKLLASRASDNFAEAKSLASDAAFWQACRDRVLSKDIRNTLVSREGKGSPPYISVPYAGSPSLAGITVGDHIVCVVTAYNDSANVYTRLRKALQEWVTQTLFT